MRTIACGSDFTLVIQGDSHQFARGYSQRLTASNQPNLEPDERIKHIACGYNHTVFITTKGSLWGRGIDKDGQLGLDGAHEQSEFVPLPVPALSEGIEHVACGYNHTVFITTKGRLWGTGRTFPAQPNGGVTQWQTEFAPIPVSGLRKDERIVHVACGQYHTVFITTEGRLWGTGIIFSGQFDEGRTQWQTEFIPILVSGLRKGERIERAWCGQYHTVFITTEGRIWGAGYNTKGQFDLGLGHNQLQSKFVLICDKNVKGFGIFPEHFMFLDLLKETPRKNIKREKIVFFEGIKKPFEELMTERHITNYQIAVCLIQTTLKLVFCLKKGFFEDKSQFTLRNIYGGHAALDLLDNVFRSTLANFFIDAPTELSRWDISTLLTQKQRILTYAVAPQEKPDGKLSFYPTDRRSYSSYRYRDHLELTLGSKQGFNPLDIFQLIKNSACGYPACKGNNVCNSYKDAHTTLLSNSSFRLNMAKHSTHSVQSTADLEPKLQKHLVSLKLFAPENPFMQMQNYICKMDAVVRRLSINGGSILGDYEPIKDPARFPLPLFINPHGQVLGFFFHGTKEPNITGIHNSSFLVSRSRSSAQMYGRGTYFAIQACKAAQYTEATNPFLLLSAIQISRPYFDPTTGGIKKWGSKRYDMVMAISGYSHNGRQLHHEIVATDRTPHIPILKIKLRKDEAFNYAAEGNEGCVTM